MSSSLKTGKLILIWPPISLWHQPWCECLEHPDLSDLDDTDEKLTLIFHHSQTHGLARVWVMGVEWPIGLISSGHNPGLIEVFTLGHGGSPMSMPRLLSTFISAWEPQLWWRPSLATETKWKHCTWMCTGMSQSPSFHTSFGNGLAYYLPAFLQGHSVGIKLGLLVNPTNVSSQCEHGIMCLAQAQSFS